MAGVYVSMNEPPFAKVASVLTGLKHRPLHRAAVDAPFNHL